METRINKSNNEQNIEIAVVGAHLRGMPLNYQLTDLSANFLYEIKTAQKYKLFRLKGDEILKPGLVKVEFGSSIKLEVWTMPTENLGYFEKNISSPLCIGNIELENNKIVKGFLCEYYATLDAEDISNFGGWKAYINSINQ